MDLQKVQKILKKIIRDLEGYSKELSGGDKGLLWSAINDLQSARLFLTQLVERLENGEGHIGPW